MTIVFFGGFLLSGKNVVLIFTKMLYLHIKLK